jgi:Holliday junction resolvase RusA-like endonuclease
MKELHFSVPLLPPSVNHYKVRRFYNSPEAQAFIEAVCIFSRKQRVEGPRYQVEIAYDLAPGRLLKSDLDNFSKVALDALTAANVIADDRYIVTLRLSKRTAASERDTSTTYKVTGFAL